MPQPVSGLDEEGHTRRPRFHRRRRLLRHFPFQLLGVRKVERAHNWRQVADIQWTSGVYAFAGKERVLDSTDGEGIRQVWVVPSSNLTSTVVVDWLCDLQCIDFCRQFDQLSNDLLTSHTRLWYPYRVFARYKFVTYLNTLHIVSASSF